VRAQVSHNYPSNRNCEMVFFTIVMMFNHLACLFHFKDWIRARNRVRACKLSALIMLFLKSSFAFEIVEMCCVFMLLIKLVASS
jgi:hypothetical protein